MNVIRMSAFIRRPAEVVFHFHSDFRNRPLWHDHVLSSELTTAEPIGMGSRFKTANKTLGRTLQTEETITAYDPPQSYRYELTAGPVHVISRQTFESQDGGTVVTTEIVFRPNGGLLASLAAGLIAWRQGRHTKEALLELKAYLEGELAP